MSPSVERALNVFRTTGRLVLPGGPSPWARATKALLAVLFVLLVLLTIAAPVGMTIAVTYGGLEMTAATIVGVLMVEAILIGLLALVAFGVRRQRRYELFETSDVILEPRGLTLRGVGPIPWADFGTASYRMVPSEHSSGHTRRGVMPLTESGVYNVNVLMPPELRWRVCPATGAYWSKWRHMYVYVPSVEGMKTAEVMELVNAVRGMMGFAPVD
ncbi:hypothetical protein VR010_14395 [Actinomycetaceae bacterium L2_0104]